jgi:hypothetical protein
MIELFQLLLPAKVAREAGLAAARLVVALLEGRVDVGELGAVAVGAAAAPRAFAECVVAVAAEAGESAAIAARA